MPEKLTIEEMQQIAEERGGKCLSKKYINSKTNLEWECVQGHKFPATPRMVKNNGSWCSECYGNTLGTIEEMQQIAEERGGKCLSKKYINNKTNLEWECVQGHKFPATPSNVKNHNRWCGQCNIFYSQEICRTTFEQLFSKNFIKVKPDWLVGEKGQKLELDGYCKHLKIAFEYNGKQHYEYSKFFHSKMSLKEIRKNDEIKRELCVRKGIFLFILTFQDDLTKLPQIIKKQASIFGLDVSKIDFTKKIDFNKVYLSKMYLQECQTIAKERGGKCLSKQYIDDRTKLEWECAEGHRWEATLSNIKFNRGKGTWCGKCYGNTLGTIEEMQQIAEERGGKCLSKEYINNRTNLEWECAKGHKFPARPDNVKHLNRWCDTCGGSKRLTIEEMQAIAKERGGKCLSKEYINNKTNLEWECAKGHKFPKTPTSVKNRGSWCNECLIK